MKKFARSGPVAHWQSLARLARAPVPARYLPWLRDSGSLTQRVIGACSGEFCVQVLSQAWERPRPDEARALGMRTHAHALVRQVQLLCGNVPWVYARTIIPRATLTGAERRLARLKSRSLGAVLFSDPSMRRGRIEIAQLRPGDSLYDLATRELTSPPAEIWGRRTVFQLGGKPLLVSEFFLPGIGGFCP
jgi:chorismate--pyruvate lyase